MVTRLGTILGIFEKIGRFLSKSSGHPGLSGRTLSRFIISQSWKNVWIHLHGTTVLLSKDIKFFSERISKMKIRFFIKKVSDSCFQSVIFSSPILNLKQIISFGLKGQRGGIKLIASSGW